MAATGASGTTTVKYGAMKQLVLSLTVVTPSGEVIINELNTMPGFTATSVFPKMWAASGVGYREVITHLLVSALTRNNGVLGN